MSNIWHQISPKRINPEDFICVIEISKGSKKKYELDKETGYIILDVRRPDEFAAGHIPKAINVPNETIGTADIPELPDKNQLIMVYCRSGRRSKEASEKLVKLGYTNIVEFGGILDWKGEIVTGE